MARDLPLFDESALVRALYSRDNSLYRLTPTAVARPASIAELADVVGMARAQGLSVTARGAGTSCAGNAVGRGVVVDLRALNHLSVDPESATATVGPGVVLSDLNRAAAVHGLRFGPDPSTFTRCTVGGMIGNDACGPRALGYGRTSDNLLAATTLDPLPVDALAAIGGAHEAMIRAEFARFSRQVSGYALQHLLPERFAPHRLLAGSEGTLGIVTSATLRLARLPRSTAMVALGYPSMAEAADAVVALLPLGLLACEGLDDRIVDVARRKGPVGDLPRGRGYLVVEVGGESDADVMARAQAVVRLSGALDSQIRRGDQAAALWKVRADGAGLAAIALEQPAHAGWEDSAVPPEQLGEYLRRMEELLAAHGLHALPYGHFGEGCVHARIDFPPTEPQRIRRFLEEAATLVGSLGGSLSGEHGDGRSRSALLDRMYSGEALAAMAEVKRVCDPDRLLNPGVLVDADPVDASIARPSRADEAVHEAERCTGVGACLAHEPGGSMCPSFRATGREQDSTRGRARVLQEAMRGEVVDGLRSPEVAEVLEHCLACKACRRECPTSVDLAELKSVALEEIWRGRVRPRSHWTLGRLPAWLGLLQRVPGAVEATNLVAGGPLRRVVAWAAGLDPRRSLPVVHRWVPQPVEGTEPIQRKPVVLWSDSFSRAMDPSAVAAMVVVLRVAGLEPRLLDESVCCGLTWITTGQRKGARRHLRQALDVLYPLAAAGLEIVGMEPSCTAVWRSDAATLLPDDPRVPVVAAHVRTLAEVLATTDFVPPDLSGHTIVVQPHCHHRAVLGWPTDAALLARTGANVVTVDGCCGLAGNYGMERGHYEVSVAVAELNLLPALRQHSDAIYLADGFSCRTQAKDLAGRDGVTLAQLLSTHL